MRPSRRYCVPTPTLAPNPGYRLPARSAAFLSPLPAGWCCLTPVSPAVPPLFSPDGLTPSEPRSVRADIIPGSERSASTRRASAGRGSAPRRPGGRSALHPVRPSCGACEIRRPRQPRPPACPCRCRSTSASSCLPALTRRAVSHPPGLAARCVVSLPSHPGSPPRAVTTTLSRRDAHARSEPRLPPARTLRGSVLPIPSLLTTPPDGVDALRYRLPFPLFSPDGLTPSEPRSVRADIIPGSERSATGVPRRPGVGAPSTSFGRAAERARSAARASPGLLLAHAAATSAPTTPPDWGGRRPPTFVNPAMTPAGRLGGAGSCATRIFVDEPQGQSAIPAHLQGSLTLTRPVAPSPRSRKKRSGVPSTGGLAHRFGCCIVAYSIRPLPLHCGSCPDASR